ncbi:MAG: NAD(P)H-binding protein [Flavobacteriales bacterium]
MRILIFGATGRTGNEAIEQALKRGHTLTAFARDPSKLHLQSVRVVKGDVTEPKAVSSAMKGQDAVLCLLGQRSPFKRDPRLTIGVRNILRAMQDHDVRRMVNLSFAGVHDGRRKAGPLLNWVMVPLLHAVVADHEDREAWIEASTVDWTMVRPVMLTNGPHTAEYRYGKHINPKALVPSVSRADVADLMLRVLDDHSTFHKGLQVMH